MLPSPELFRINVTSRYNVLEAAVQLPGLELGANQRDPGCFGGFAKSHWKSLSLCHEDSRNRKGEKELEDSFPLRSLQRREIRDLCLAEYLKPLKTGRSAT